MQGSLLDHLLRCELVVDQRLHHVHVLVLATFLTQVSNLALNSFYIHSHNSKNILIKH